MNLTVRVDKLIVKLNVLIFELFFFVLESDLLLQHRPATSNFDDFDASDEINGRNEAVLDIARNSQHESPKSGQLMYKIR